ncbi:MAG: AAA family ATPase [Nitrospira sp.]|nr:AAA family ATPase [Nitrospira sp.]
MKHIPFAVVTNGSAWIVFPAIRTDEVTFENTQARIFRDLGDIKTRIVEFWKLLSRQRVAEGNLEHELLSPEKNASARRVLSLVREPGFRLGRNALYEHIEPAVNAALTDEALLNDPEALKLCYVKSSERLKYDSRLQMVVSDAKTYLGHKTTRVRSRKSQGYLETKITQDVPGRPRFILVLGAVGSGKTTFLHYTRKVSAASQIDGKVLWLYIDFKKTTQNQNPRQFLYEELRSIIETEKEFELGDWGKSIMPAYAETISNLERGPLFLLKKSDKAAFDKEIASTVMKDREALVPYVEKILRHAVSTRPGFLVIDNVDQIDSDERQNEIFSEAQAAAQRMGINIIMSLRESTFLRHRSSPVFDAFQFDSLYIDPPSVLPVLSRRFTYARQVLAGRKAELTLESGIHLKVPDISVFFNIVAQSVLASDSGFMIEMLSGGDIRRGLSLVREFLSSGHTTADRALSAYIRDGKYKFPPHEIFKGAVLGKRTVYREEESALLNIYDSKLDNETLQLLRFQLLARLVDLAADATFEGITVSDIIDQLHVIGVPSGLVESCLRTLLDSRTVRTADGLSLSPQSKIIPNRLAGYLIHELGSSFNYFEMCLVDSYIFQKEFWTRISDLTTQIQNAPDEITGVKLRVDRARLYIRYLSSIEERWIVECNRRGIGDSWGHQWIETETQKRLEDDMSKALTSAENMARRRVREGNHH